MKFSNSRLQGSWSLLGLKRMKFSNSSCQVCGLCWVCHGLWSLLMLFPLGSPSPRRCRYYDATASLRKFRRWIPSHGSLGPPSLRRYSRYDATVSLWKFRRRGSEAKVRSGPEAVDATLDTMPRFRSGTSADAVPKQRFARARKSSRLLRWWGLARKLPSTRFRSKVW